MEKPEIMAPAGDWRTLRTAVNAGADSVYFGLKGATMRNKVKNFDYDNLKKAVDYCHANNVKVYVTVNSIVYEWDLEKNKKDLEFFKENGVDAVICWDISVIKQARALGLDVHLSTQASVSNSEAVTFFKALGVRRVVLARECSLDQIREIINKTNCEVEVFVHGAMCMAISGRCFLSQFTDNKSANRGICIHNCRREYTVIDDDGNKLRLGNDYILSAEDLCTIPFIEKLIEAGINCFKIEGRNKGPEYVKTTVEAYKSAVDFYFENKEKEGFENEFNKLKKELMKKLSDVYNRGQSLGFFLGKKVEDWNDVYGNKSNKVRIEIGRIENYLKKLGVAIISIFSNEIRIGDELHIIGDTTGLVEQKVESMELDGNKVEKVGRGLVAIKIDKLVREGDSVNLWKNREDVALKVVKEAVEM